MTHSAENTPATPKTHESIIELQEGAKPPRLHHKTRRAIDLLVSTGQTQRWCAQQAGINEDAFSRALAKPQYKEYRQQQEVYALQDLKAARKKGEIAAINKAMYLMNNAKSENVQARMVEFFAGEGGKHGPSVAVNVTQNAGTTGYEMVKPGQRVVDITPDSAPLTRDQGDKGEDTQ